MKSSKKILRELTEGLIGLECKVVNSTQRDAIGIHGQIIDETLKTLTIKTKKGEKKLNKKEITLEIKFKNQKATLKGEELTQRPHERLRKFWRKIR